MMTLKLFLKSYRMYGEDHPELDKTKTVERMHALRQKASRRRHSEPKPVEHTSFCLTAKCSDTRNARVLLK